MKRLLFILPILSSAFLLFQIQPILTKVLLPEFGGSSAVWSASMLFYQSVLLFGYLYAHGLSKLRLNTQFVIHATLLLLSTHFTFSGEAFQVSNAAYPVFSVIAKLTQEVGLAFFLLSATSVLLQQWYFRTRITDVPYHWYSFSNLASLVGLICYPFFVETYWPTSLQKHFWFGLYAITVTVKLMLMAHLYLTQQSAQSSTSNPSGKVSVSQQILWVTLSATSSIMLVATTQLMSINIPPMPLVWLLPLVIYLASYTICFTSKRAYPRAMVLPLLSVAILFGFVMYFLGSQFNAPSQLIIYSLILLVCCITCHGELRAHAPKDNAMTTFYVAIALGGALGSLFSSIIAPLIFDRITEYVLGLFLVTIGFICTRPSSAEGKNRLIASLGSAAALTTLMISYLYVEHRFDQYDVATTRNFYGYIAVKDVEVGDIAERRLVDGTTVHGSQPLDDDSTTGNSYYQPDSGVAIALSYLKQKAPLDIGVIGLGAGVLASYSRPQDSVTFFELNPAVYDMATTYFSYLDNAQGQITVNIDDGRLAIARQLESSNEKFNAIIVDAFSSDVIPAHLLTREAFEIYWQRLAPNGLLILHISNNHIDLMPVVMSHAHYFNKKVIQWTKTTLSQASFGSDWVVLTDDEHFVSLNRASTAVFPATKINGYDTGDDNVVTWTDEHYSLLKLIKF